MRVLRLAVPLTFLLGVAFLLRPAVGEPPKPAFRLAIMPFTHGGGVPADWRFQLVLPLDAAEMLERFARDPEMRSAMESGPFRFEVVEWPIVLPDETPAIMPGRVAPDLFLAAEVARSRGATHMLTGRYSGRVERWTLTIEVYDLAGDRVSLASSASRTEFIFDLKARVVDIGIIQKMLAEATTEALDALEIRMPDPARAAFAVPPANYTYTMITLGRAYDRHFWPAGNGTDAIGWAQIAVGGDPAYVEARRFHAWLLGREGRTEKSLKRAIGVYIEALKRRPDDVRSLLGVGELASVSGDFDDAIRWLERALGLRPDSAPGHRWLGVALAGKGKLSDAFGHLERARDLEPADLAIRRTLKDLYARERRYADAARELREIVAADRNDLAAIFELGSCLRALGKPGEAALIYAAAEPAFPKEARLPKFRGDALIESGSATEAAAAYAAALKIAPKDPRLGRQDPDVLGGTALAAEVAEALALRDALSGTADAFQMLANDAEAEFWIRTRWPAPEKGKEDVPDLRRDTLCPNGEAASNVAARHATDYEKDAVGYRAAVRRIAASLKGGEGAALTPDRQAIAESLVDSAEYEARVAREIVRTLAVSIPALRRQARCGEDGSLSVDLKEVEARNASRVVPPDAYVGDRGSAIMPFIPAGASRIIRFQVDNARGTVGIALVMIVDGRPSADHDVIPAGGSVRFSIRAGSYRYCLLPVDQAARCGQAGTIRSNYLYEGVRITFY